MKKILFFLLCAVGMTLVAAELSFDRPSKAGDVFTAEINQSISREYRFDFAGNGKKIEKKGEAALTLFAAIEVLSVNSAGNPDRLKIEIRTASGIINSVPFDSRLLNGKTVIADLRKHPCGFQFADGKPVPKNSMVFLMQIFRTAPRHSTAELLGKSVPLRTGYQWAPSTKSVLESLKQRDFPVKPENLRGRADLGKIELFRGIKCISAGLLIESRKVPNLDFRLKATFRIPTNPRDGGIVQTVRDGVEILERSFTDAGVYALETSVQIITKEHFEAVMIPGAPAKKEKSTFRFSDMIFQ